MRKHQLYSIWHRTSNVSLLILAAGFIISAGLGIYSLRANNLKMLQLKQVVYSADEGGGDVEAALKELRLFVYSHMNTNLRAGSNSNEPPIQLVNKFNKAVAAEEARVAASGGANIVYVEAQNQCEKSNIPLTARAQCIQQYVTDHGGNIPQLNLPPKELYTFDFVGPIWSPDLAGWSLILCSLFAVLLVSWVISHVAIKRYLK